jgi:hypothetical protein
MDGIISLLIKVSQNIFCFVRAVVTVKIRSCEFKERNSSAVKVGQA